MLFKFTYNRIIASSLHTSIFLCSQDWSEVVLLAFVWVLAEWQCGGISETRQVSLRWARSGTEGQTAGGKVTRGQILWWVTSLVDTRFHLSTQHLTDSFSLGRVANITINLDGEKYGPWHTVGGGGVMEIFKLPLKICDF